ncbi:MULTISPECIES: helix-turn-helix transcriptional regulator [Streptomyces]|uniref:Helix-turn-helix domain-containing protein n=1 Tax=Streptomyces koelreuteriae TaxID=2838015 RepID=A0ABX8FRQ6_9ACTN|nr:MULTISPECIES: helix-turn-helix transcriptional regulator [Streptomyces]QWB23856.1 helix-turn-helix domain-containing protein [Streptomyces koelreuteriae]UUA06836.1 helix-turn-helix domain-containing protein [Streptomyces koelreuteriae]UUA14465.1 helix-turn-helix domain-containing protein [Streptomyces sp. CRCS-T-1]
MGANAVLKSRMDELGLTQEELAGRMNAALAEITGKAGDVCARTIRNLLNGTSRRPIGRTCAALERVFDCPVEDLGFSAPRSMHHPQEDPVRRRTFIASATGTAAAAVPLVTQRRAVGMSDVARAADGMNALVDADDRQGGHADLEKAAVQGRDSVLELQQRNAGERVRRALYALAAEYSTIAAWSCIDARNLDQAQRHLNESATYAGLSQDGTTEMRVWVNLSMLAYQRQNWPEALAAAQAAQASSAARRDPFFDSLGRVRVALAYAALGDGHAGLRSLGSAQDTFTRVADRDRPRWTAFYGQAELDHLAAIVQFNSGRHPHAEALAHRALTRIPSAFRRNRALATAQLALAQLHQGEAEQATASATDVFTIMGGGQLPGRMRTLIGDFHRGLFVMAPSASYARDWADRMRTEWSRA